MRGIWCASLSGEREAEKFRDVLQKFLQALARRVLDQHLRIAIFRNPAFVDKDQPRSYFLGKTDFVGHDHHRHPFFSQILHNLQHFMAQFRVKSGSRFIKQHHFRLHRQRAGNRHTLLLTTRKFGRVVMCTFCQTDFRQQLTRQFFRLFFIRATHA